MLTKELLRFSRKRDNSIHPRFIDTQDRALQSMVDEMVAIYTHAEGLNHEEISEMIQPIIGASRSPLVAKGINKLLFDRCEFHAPDEGIEKLRMDTFMEATRQLAAPTVGRLEEFRESVAQTMGYGAETLTAALFADLQHRQTLEKFRPVGAERLLHRYNMAQVQGLLLGATHLELEIIDPDVGRLRQFFRQLKFFQLLATILQKGPGHFHIALDGPLSLFEQVRKYGQRFANILPAICHLEKWTLTAQIRPGDNKNGHLTLDNSSGLVSHYPMQNAYIPPEFERFSTQFTEKNPAWPLLADTHTLHVEGTDLIVADFTFRAPNGFLVHLELFHRWHAAPLVRRLQQLENQKKSKKIPKLAIAVDRALYKDAVITQKLEQSPYFQQHGFLFNEFPSVKSAFKCLESFLPHP